MTEYDIWKIFRQSVLEKRDLSMEKTGNALKKRDLGCGKTGNVPKNFGIE